MSEKTVLDREDVRRTLVRIAHEIVEKTGGEGVAVVGIHRRGAVLGARLRDLVAELVGEPVPLGDVDISFYRDDVSLRRNHPVVTIMSFNDRRSSGVSAIVLSSSQRWAAAR